jgi:hypothetical protein
MTTLSLVVKKGFRNSSEVCRAAYSNESHSKCQRVNALRLALRSVWRLRQSQVRAGSDSCPESDTIFQPNSKHNPKSKLLDRMTSN